MGYFKIPQNTSTEKKVPLGKELFCVRGRKGGERGIFAKRQKKKKGGGGRKRRFGGWNRKRGWFFHSHIGLDG